MTSKLLRFLRLLASIVLLVVGIWLFVGDLLVLAHLRPLPDDGYFGVMVGPILAAVGGFLTWQSLAAFHRVKPISIKPR